MKLEKVFAAKSRIAEKELMITDPKMTRFLMSLEEAVELVIYAFLNANTGDIMVQKVPVCTIEILAQAISEIFDVEPYVEKLKNGGR